MCLYLSRHWLNGLVDMQEKFNKGGEGLDSWIQPKCNCGWVGSKHYAHNDYQHTNAHEQRQAHKRKCLHHEKEFDVRANGGEEV